MISRSDFLKSMTATGFGFFGVLNFKSAEKPKQRETASQFSLSQFALHKAIWGNSRDNYSQWEHNLKTDPDLNWQGNLHPLDFPAKARELGFNAVDYVASIVFGHADDKPFLTELKNRTNAEGISNQFIAVGEEGMIGDPDPQKRKKAIENHYKWMEAAKFLGCHSIRADAHSYGPWEEQVKLASEGVYKLAEKADEIGIDLMLENHGGMSCNADWLVEVIEAVNHHRVKTLVDLDNFVFSEEFLWGSGGKVYNRYEGVRKLMPRAKAISAKSYEFDIRGFETRIDYPRMMEIISEFDFEGYFSVEYEGTRHSEEEGILATKALIEKEF